jgi:hypothetical protein
MMDILKSFSVHNSCKQFCLLVCTYSFTYIHEPSCSLLILLNVFTSLKYLLIFVDSIFSSFNQCSVNRCNKAVNVNNLFLSCAHCGGELRFVKSLNNFCCLCSHFAGVHP